MDLAFRSHPHLFRILKKTKLSEITVDHWSLTNHLLPHLNQVLFLLGVVQHLRQDLCPESLWEGSVFAQYHIRNQAQPI